MFQRGKNGRYFRLLCQVLYLLTACRAAEQSEGNRTVGVDPTVITARKDRIILFMHWT